MTNKELWKKKAKQLETENAALKSALIEIRDFCQRTVFSFEEQAYRATRIAIDALKSKTP